jgi:hypothetical protein
MQVFRSRGVEASRRIAATERVRDLVASGNVPDAIAVETTGLGDIDWIESFPGDKGRGD